MPIGGLPKHLSNRQDPCWFTVLLFSFFSHDVSWQFEALLIFFCTPCESSLVLRRFSSSIWVPHRKLDITGRFGFQYGSARLRFNILALQATYKTLFLSSINRRHHKCREKGETQLSPSMDPVKDALFIMQIYYAPETSPGYNMTLHVVHAVHGMSAPSLGIAHGNGMQMAAMVVSAGNLYVFGWTLLKTTVLCLFHFNLCTLSSPQGVP